LPAAGATFDVDVAAVPETSTIEVDGVPVATGRFTRIYPRDGQRHVLRVSAPAHESVLVEFDEARPPPAHVTLRATAARPVNAPPPPIPHVAAPPPKVGPPTTKGGGDRPKTDNIDPWE
jgi:hypothetical protein